MKRFFFVWAVLAVLLPLPLQARIHPSVDGLGVFKFGSAPEALGRIGYNLSRPVVVNTKKAYLKKVHEVYTGHALCQLFPDPSDRMAVLEASYHPDVKVFYIPAYEPVPGVLCQGVMLKYIHDSLFYIGIERSQGLASALATKYGAPEVDKKKSSCKCERNGRSFTLWEESTSYTYPTGDPDVACHAYLDSGYGRNCDKHISGYLFIYRKSVKKRVDEYDARRRRELIEEEMRAKMEDLQGL